MPRAGGVSPQQKHAVNASERLLEVCRYFPIPAVQGRPPAFLLNDAGSQIFGTATAQNFRRVQSFHGGGMVGRPWPLASEIPAHLLSQSVAVAITTLAHRRGDWVKVGLWVQLGCIIVHGRFLTHQPQHRLQRQRQHLATARLSKNSVYPLVTVLPNAKLSL